MTLADFLMWHLRASLVLAIGGGAVELICRWRSIDDSRGRLAAAVAVLLMAWWPWGWRVDLAWLSPREQATWDGAEERLPSRSWAARSPNDTPTIAPEQSRAPAADSSHAAWGLASGEQQREPARRWWSRGIPASPASLAWCLSAAWGSAVGSRVVFGAFRYGLVVRETAGRPQGAIESQIDHWNNEWRRLLQAAGVPTALPLFATRQVGPLLGRLPGGFALLVPWRLWRDLPAVERQLVMRHELAHYLRGDIWTSCFIRLLALPFVYHPSAWRLAGLVEESAEWACDSWAIAGVDPNERRVAYARALERLAASGIPETSLALGRCAQSHPLVLRVGRVLKGGSEKENRKDRVMKRMLLASALVALALGSLVQVRLVAQDDREATIERVKKQIRELEARIEATRGAADELRESGKKLESRVKERLEELKRVADDVGSWNADARQRLDRIKSGEESAQLAALDGVEKFGDEGLVVLAHAILANDREAVRRKALGIVTSLGDEGLPVLAKGFESLAAKDREWTVKEILKHKDKFDSMVFARLAGDDSAEIRSSAIEAGLTKGKPLAFIATLKEGRPEVVRQLWESSKTLSADDMRIILFAAAKTGPEELLPETVQRAAKLGEDGYPIVAVVFKRGTPDSRAEIVRTFRKSTKPIERFVVEEALKDEDATLREAAAKADSAP